MYKICVLVILSLLTSACVVSRGELDTLSSRLWEQEQKQRQVERQLAAMDQELSRITTELEGPIRLAQANLWAELEGLRTQTATIQGQMEELQRSVHGSGGREALADLARQVATLDRSVTMIASQLAIDLGPRPGAPGAEDAQALLQPAPDPLVPRPDTPPAAPPAQAADDPAQALYDEALRAFHARNFAQAQRMWAEFAKTFPEHELVSNANFWQGEAFFQMGDYAQAVLAYQDVISKHPKSNKYAASMLKQGVCFFRLGKNRAGVLVLEDLINRFPALPEAARAKTILEEQKRQ
jgi:tol-pal system protein YbgF